MGRRKIEIKPIKDDRNRSVTFLKRKGGLFKKAHELSVLCSVDVAVIIFGHNKKLYEYSSGDINETIARFQYYGAAHEHKGPQDFADKGGDDDEDDEGGEDEAGDARATPDHHQQMMQQQQQQQQHAGLQHHPGLQHVRHGTPQASPPMPNGAMPHFQRGPSPLPPGISRPSSRTSQHPMQHPQQHPQHPPQHLRRTSSNLAPPGHPQHTQGPPPPQPTYAYAPNQPFYNAQAAGQVQMQRPPPQATYPPPYQNHHPQHPGVAQAMLEDNRRQSMPPAIPPYQPQQAQMQPEPSHDHLQPPPQRPPIASPQPQQQQQPGPVPSPQPPQHHDFASPPIPQPKPLPAHAKHNSIFTPIDDSRSLLAQHWGSGTSGMMEHSRSEPTIKLEDGGPRPASIDVAALNRDKLNGTSPRPPPARAPHQSPQAQTNLQPPQRTASTSSVPIIAPPARASTAPDAKRPRLKVQIPSEASGDEAATADSDAASSSQLQIATGPQQQQGQHSHVVLPPPSPSTNTLLSAGAQGPPNPFARPPPPMSTNPHAANRENIETPMSALPSRFMQEMLPSPSTFYSEWGFGRANDNNMLPSPLNFQTPVVGNGQGWREEDRKRAAEEEATGADAKRSKS